MGQPMTRNFNLNTNILKMKLKKNKTFKKQSPIQIQVNVLKLNTQIILLNLYLKIHPQNRKISQNLKICKVLI